METTALTPAGIVTTRLGFGCAGLMRLPSRRERQSLLAGVFENGVRHFDVARMYGLGATEAEVGAFAKGRRDSITIATKFGMQPHPAAARLARFQAPARSLIRWLPALRRGIKRGAAAISVRHRYDAATARSSLERSLRELQTDYVDILFLHAPTTEDAVGEEVCEYLEDARRAGFIRAWGIAGDSDACVAVRRAIPVPIVSQMRADIFSKPSGRFDPSEAVIIFGVLSEALPRVLAHVTASSARQRHWSEVIGADCADPSVIAGLLLRDVLCSRPDDVVLFGTTQIDHARASIGAATQIEACEQDSALAAFRALVVEELLPQRRVAER